MRTLEEFEQMLKKHDWTYDYADNGLEYRKGAVEAEAIRKVINGYTGADRLKAEALYRKYRKAAASSSPLGSW